MVTEGPGKSGTRIIETDYPSIVGLEAGTTKMQDEVSLKPDVNIVQSNQSWGCC